jgi:signal transduction histidine kinase
MTLQADSARELLEENPAEVRRILDDRVGQLQGSTADIRRLVYELRPPALDDLGLARALKSHLEKTSSARLRMSVEAPDSLPPLAAAVEVAAYRIVQEAVANVVRHAEASSCTVRIFAEGNRLVLEVEDDGTGIPEAAAGGVGLRSMRERASRLGGMLEVETAPCAGTRICAWIPV